MRLLIFGVDAATPEILFSDEQKIRFPKVEAIMNGGIYGRLKSVDPCQTGPAWTSFYTGLDPDEHGVKDKWGRGAFEEIANNKLPFWYKLTNAGANVGIFNMPCTYPAVNPGGESYLVSGFPVPDEGTRYFYPPGLKLPDDYVVDIMNEDKSARIPKKKQEDYIRRCLQIEILHHSTFLEINKEFDIDVAMVQYAVLDRLGHRFWTAESPPFIINMFYGTIFNVFLPKLLDELKPDNLLILSDHGFRGGGSRGRDEGGIDDHSYYGVFMMYGKDFNSMGEKELNIKELAPIILAMFGIYPPYKEGCKQYVNADILKTDDESINEQLKGLGYI